MQCFIEKGTHPNKPFSNQLSEREVFFPKNWVVAHIAYTLNESQITFLGENENMPPMFSESERLLIGYVSEDSNARQIKIELISPYIDLNEVGLVTTSIKGREVL